MIAEIVGEIFSTPISQAIRITQIPSSVMITGTMTSPTPRSAPASTSMNTYTMYQGVIQASISDPHLDDGLIICKQAENLWSAHQENNQYSGYQCVHDQADTGTLADPVQFSGAVVLTHKSSDGDLKGRLHHPEDRHRTSFP